MKLQILVPQYNENDDTVKPLLDSIEVQQNIDKNDIGVIIVNDGSYTHLSRTLLDRYSYHIDYYLHENKGVSATRNACLDYATADYIMFCDADDMFYHIEGLYTIFCEIEKKDFDILNPNFIQEIRNKNTGKAKFMFHPRNCTHVHGKVYKRKFLVDNNIRWDNRLTIHEDGYFNTLCIRLAKSIVNIENPFYLWKWRSESITRKKPNFLVNTYEHYVAIYDALVDEFLRRGRQYDAQDLITAGLFKFYFMSNSAEWEKHESEEHKLIAEKSIKDFYLKFKALYKAFSVEKRNKIILKLQNGINKKNTALPAVRFEDWLIQLETI